jgi:AraC family transcriptional activator of tynA and feaB
MRLDAGVSDLESPCHAVGTCVPRLYSRAKEGEAIARVKGRASLNGNRPLSRLAEIAVQFADNERSGSLRARGADLPARSARQYLVDVSVPSAAPDPIEVLHRGWDQQVGGVMPIPPVTSPPGVDADYRVRILHSKVDDAVLEDLYSEAIVGGTGGRFNHMNDRVVVHLVQKGEWRFSGLRDPDFVSVGSEQLCIRYNNPPWQFEIDPATRAQVLVLPATELRPLVGDRAIVSSQTDPEAQLLMAYLNLLRATLKDLTDAGVRAARNAMMELLKGVLAHRVVVDEPQLFPALLQAAKEVAEAHLLDADLAPRDLAQALNVSVRTLHRAFAGADESVMAYVRARRLEQARLELAASPNRPAVSELAARWHFSDSSHFTRAFKQRYGETPTAYSRRAWPDQGHAPDHR